MYTFEIVFFKSFFEGWEIKMRFLLFFSVLITSMVSGQTSVDQRLQLLETLVLQHENRIKALEKPSAPTPVPSVQTRIIVEAFKKDPDQSDVPDSTLKTRYILKFHIEGPFDSVSVQMSHIGNDRLIETDKWGRADTKIIVNDVHNNWITIAVKYNGEWITHESINI